MQEPIKPIPTPDKLFHDGNPVSGELGTIVSAEWLNGMQSAAQATQEEVLAVIKDSGQGTDPKRKDQLLQAVKQIAWGGNSKPTTLAGYGIGDALPLKPALGVVDLNDINVTGLYSQRGTHKRPVARTTRHPMPASCKSMPTRIWCIRTIRLTTMLVSGIAVVIGDIGRSGRNWLTQPPRWPATASLMA
ncbi:hypothetical protein [Chromobacterium sp. Beijing]|uniref:hypothetical protein n=1 Tax=Chromobacterium sp. Beijing TaxID=2735795 RepID=UPI001F1B3206|nr:hypothetical protein [Chromobacterium sp. Beijing]UJB33021.1 hypothetical protein HQN78_19345 [Chromobacterium sp. Beijing]